MPKGNRNEYQGIQSISISPGEYRMQYLTPGMSQTQQGFLPLDAKTNTKVYLSIIFTGIIYSQIAALQASSATRIKCSARQINYY